MIYISLEVRPNYFPPPLLLYTVLCLMWSEHVVCLKAISCYRF